MPEDFVGRWRKSSFSGNDANCVEIGYGWRKSSFSGNDSNCVELAWAGAEVGIRDSKNPGAGHVTISAGAFARLIDTVKHGA
jgi:hypothetical protein